MLIGVVLLRWLISRRLLMLNLRRLTWVIRDSRRLDIRRS
jgi:hypothetical protein